ncbi:MAG: hypothetical protein QXK24_04670 [Ignisphaera sp.]
MKNKKIIPIIVIIMITIFHRFSLSSPEAVVSAGSATLTPGGTANIPITVSNIPTNGGLGAYDIKVTFNPTVINILDITGGSTPFDAITAKNIDNINGWARFNHFITATQGPTGSITIAYLIVKAVGSAGSSTNIGIEATSLIDAKTGSEIPRSTSPGSVNIISPKKPSSISITIDKTQLNIYEQITIQGSINPARPGATVTITYTKPDYTTITHTVTADSTGSYTDKLTVDMKGKWNVKSSWPGDSDYEGATSTTLTFNVIGKQSVIIISITPLLPSKNEEVIITGEINPPQKQTPVTIYVEKEGTKQKLGTTYTNDKGQYTYKHTFTHSGGVKLYVEWPGNKEYEGATNTITLTIEEKITKSEITLPTGEKTEIRAASNSTNYQIQIKPEETKITINATGPEKTIGILKITIPKSLLEAYNSNIHRVTFTLDGKIITPTSIIETTENYLITLTYQHSTRIIEIYYLTYDLTIKTLDYNGKPLAKAEINMTGPITITTKTDTNGTTTITKLPQGTYNTEIYYGPKVGETTIKIPETTLIIINTTAGKYETLYNQATQQISQLQKQINQLQNQIETLENTLQKLETQYYNALNELQTYRNLTYIFIVTTIVATALYTYTQLKKKNKIP